MYAHRLNLPFGALPEIEDDTVLELLRTDHPLAPAQLVARFGDRVYALALRILASEEDAKDVMTETFVTILRKWPTFKQQSRFSSWIYRIAHNQACMMRRRRSRHNRLVSLDADRFGPHADSAEGSVAVIDTLANAAPSPDRVLEQRELNGQLQRALDSLDPMYRYVYCLKEIDGLSLKEISALTQLTEPTVKTRVHRAREQLRRKLAHIR